DNLTIRKRFTFHGDRYPFEVTVDAPNVPPGYTEIGISWSKQVDALLAPGADVIFDQSVLLDDRKLVASPFDKLADGKIASGSIGWAGYAGRHFLAALIPLDARNQRVWQKLHDHTVDTKILLPIAAGPVTVNAEVYVGPKDFDVLETVGHDLSRAVALGWFG